MPDDVKLFVDHTYRDFSRYIEGGGQVVKHKKSGANFPAKLHQMLSDPQFLHIIMWMPHGRAWKIVDKDLLMSIAVPKYFVQTKFESFTRQLSGWGFKRLHRSGPDFGCYYSECFLRGAPLLTCLMRRMIPSKDRKRVPFAEGEPDFYAISRLNPLPPPLGEESSTLALEGSSEATAVSMPVSQPAGWSNAQNTRMDIETDSSATSASATMSPPTSMMSYLHSNEMANWSDTQYPTASSARNSSTSISATITMAPSASQHYVPSFYETTQNPTMPLDREPSTSSSNSIQEFPTSSLAYAMATPTQENHLPSYQTRNIANAQNLRADETAQDQSKPSAEEHSTSFTASTSVPHHMNYPHSFQMANNMMYPRMPMALSSSAPARFPEAPTTNASAFMNYQQPPCQIQTNVQANNYGGGCDHYSTHDQQLQPSYYQQESTASSATRGQKDCDQAHDSDTEEEEDDDSFVHVMNTFIDNFEL
eukprot:CAMPEP_0172328224 /NCGR_PEP_ID=MMETSP1058-20130122/60241_1 /TAXON_ID=83371 /ORGANISM="Detonula confervacea, Strain CCMP 353" /LENGTH=477 /DNA_ID=CAMNT_0013045327 /DNA_START=79 /DNA_END=1512 /DNA_ORIENTATION=+